MPLKPSIDTNRLRTREDSSIPPPSPGTNSRPETPFGSHDLLAVPLQTPVVGTPTTCVHVVFSSKLGWMAWKDREASLFELFERVFGCVRGELNFSESLTEFGVELELPNDQVARMEKEFKSKFLLAEIDKIHGISPSMRAPDCKVVRTTKSLGSGILSDSIKSSIESLQIRVNNLRTCGLARAKEVAAIEEQWNFLRDRVTKRCDKTEERIIAKPDKLQDVEGQVVTRVMAELKIIQEW
ncbi:hypothetical protein BC830DRAFT_1099621 [Chytriomyces sp. MP71]|nr:hypothetical protein BC830DRAFT_1099621 [Chytriomyces sp. MP71]